MTIHFHDRSLYQVPSEEALRSLHVQLQSRHLTELRNQLTLKSMLHHHQITSRLNIDNCRKLLDNIQRMTAVLNEKRPHLACANKALKLCSSRSKGHELIRNCGTCPSKITKKRSQKFHASHHFTGF